MRPDQVILLKELAERLADVFIAEAEPDDWPGADTPASEWTKEVRGDRVWVKKGAMATGGVLRYTLDLLARDAPVAGGQPEDGEKDSDLDRQIRDAERRATEAVNRALSRAKKKPGQAQGVGGA